MIQDSKEAPRTVITRAGIRHTQPPSRISPGGEIFIPFCHVREVKAGLIQPLCHRCPSHFLVSQVFVITDLEDEASLAVKGFPKVLHQQENWRKCRTRKIIKLRIRGIRDPIRFKEIVMANASYYNERVS